MIINKTILNKKDIEFLCSNKNLNFLFVKLIFLSIGIIFLTSSFTTIYLKVSNHPLSLDLPENNPVLYFTLIMGLLFVFIFAFSKKIAVSKSLNSPIMKSLFTFEFFEDHLISKLTNNEYDTESRFSYSLIDTYYKGNNAIYIKLKNKSQKTFLILHDDSYLEGTKEELILLLEKKQIRRSR